MVSQQKDECFIIYTEKLPYLQSSSLHLFQRENQGYRSYDTVWLDYHSRITLYILHLLDKKHDLSGLAFVNPCTYPICICNNGQRDTEKKNFIWDIQMIKTLTTNPFFVFK